MTWEVVSQWSEMRGLSPYDAAREIKLLMDIGTVQKEKRPFAEGRCGKEITAIIHEIG